ncbi:MAG: cytochrome c maturation protein CcmE [Rhodospirillales bacterium]|nr:cytochrome c maturation protein CcmE [Rhodospirillales bacterium]
MTRKRRRLYVLLAAMACLGVATALVLSAFDDSLVFFYSPSDVVEKHIGPDRRIRIGGLVEPGSLSRQGTTVDFRVTDGAHTIPVTYQGALPDLFREGQGVVAEGRLEQGVFRATTVLAKHDEKYMPPEVADALKRSGHWNPEASGAARPQ